MINKENIKEKDNRYYIMENLIAKIIKKPTKKGDNYYFSIPIEFIRSKKIELDKRYELLIYKIEEESNIKSNIKSDIKKS